MRIGHTIITVLIALLGLSFFTTACSIDDETTQLSQQIRLEFDHSLVTTTRPDENTLRLTFRSSSELRNRDEEDEHMQDIARFAVENFEYGDEISTVIIVIDEPSMDAATTAASRTTLEFQTAEL